MGARVDTEFLNLFVRDWMLLSDFADFFLGDLIGHGDSRSVYNFRLNSKMVVKIDRSGQFNNVSEWDIWHNVKDKPELAKFLAPCVHISSCGKVMIQAKTKPVTLEQLPEMVPAFFADRKLGNWGRIGKHVVCHDYANHKFFTGLDVLEKAEWINLI